MQGRHFRSPLAGYLLTLTFLYFFSFTNQLHATEHVNALWVAESSGVIKVATVDGAVLLEIEDVGEASAVAVDHERSLLWVYGKGTLRAYGFDGVLETQIEIDSECQSIASSHNDHEWFDDNCNDHDYHFEHLGHERAVNLVVDGNTGNLWLSIHKTLYYFDNTGNYLSALSFEDVIQAITFEAPSNRLWIAVSKKIVSTTDGSTIESTGIDLKRRVVDLAYDDELEQLWVASNQRILRYATDGSVSFELPFKHLSIVEPDGVGGVWLAAKRKLYRIDASGLIHLEMRPFHGFGEGRMIDIVVDPTDHTAWVASKRNIKHIDPDGQILDTVNLEQSRGHRRIKIRDLAIYSDAVAPKLTILSPTNSSYINAQTPETRFGNVR